MEMDALIDQIMARVTEKLDACDVCEMEKSEHPKILVLTDNKEKESYEIPRNANIREIYEFDHLGASEKEVDLDAYEAIIIGSISCTTICRLADGISDSPFLETAMTAILKGKKIYLPKEMVALYRYRQSAPHAYYAMIENKLEMLQKSGITLCKGELLEACILNGSPAEEAFPEVEVPKKAEVPKVQAAEEAEAPAASRVITHRVITESDVVKAHNAGIGALDIEQRSLLTDLARERAKEYNIRINRQ